MKFLTKHLPLILIALFFIGFNGLVFILRSFFIEIGGILKLYTFFLLVVCLFYFIVFRKKDFFRFEWMIGILAAVITPLIMLLYLSVNMLWSEPIFTTTLPLKYNETYLKKPARVTLKKHNVPLEWKRMIEWEFSDYKAEADSVKVSAFQGVFGYQFFRRNFIYASSNSKSK